MMTRLAVVVVALVWAAVPARAGEQPSVTFAVSGQNVRDAGGAVVGDPDATGVVTLSAVGDTLVWSLNYQNLGGDTVTGLHVHPVGAAGEAPVWLNLLPGFPAPTLPLSSPSGTLSGVVTSVQDPGLLTEMAGIFYGNEQNAMFHVHTSGPGGFPNGAMAGVLPEPGSLGLVAFGAAALLRRRR